VLGLTVVRSASTELAVDYLPRQAAWVAVGVAAMAIGFLVNHVNLLRLALPLYGLGLVALVLTLFFGHEAGGARSWIGIGGLGGQPSDLAKLASILVLVRYLGASDHDRLQTRELLVVVGVVALPALLIALEPDLGGALILLPAAGSLVWLAGSRCRTISATASAPSSRPRPTRSERATRSGRRRSRWVPASCWARGTCRARRVSCGSCPLATPISRSRCWPRSAASSA
jgi:cell division protein FtsW (lipid II flippase)